MDVALFEELNQDGIDLEILKEDKNLIPRARTAFSVEF